MLLPDFVFQIKEECKPVELVTPDATIGLMVQNTLRYLNTKSAFPLVRMYDATPETKLITLDTDFKNVVRVYPSTTADWILQNYPLWSLLGVTVIDNITSDLILMAEGFKNYRYYIGADFRFNFQRSEDPSVGSSLYLFNVPSSTTKICVVGTKRFSDVEDITSDYAIDWILRYAKALTLITEGNTLRKADAIGVRNDGQALIDENKKEVELLQKELADSGRWYSFARRM